jgi:hypothetical protein
MPPSLPARPPYECRITARCLRGDLGLALSHTATFDSLATKSEYLAEFFEQLAVAGAAGSRIRAIESREVFSFSDELTLGATWLDETKSPIGIVWLLAAVGLDSVGSLGARERLAARERTDLFPSAIDYARFDLDRRKLDTGDFASAATRDATAFVTQRRFGTPIVGKIAGVPVAALWKGDRDYVGVYIGISQEPIEGLYSEQKIRLTTGRFLLIAAAVRRALRSALGEPLIDEEPRELPRELRAAVRDPRAILLVYNLPR